MQLRLVFCVVPPFETQPIPGTESFLTYIQRFNIVPQINPRVTGSYTRRGPYPEPASMMFMLKRAQCQDQTIIGDVIPLEQLRSLVQLTPAFGKVADRRLAKESSLEYSTNFWLDKYFDKELYYALTL